MKNGTPVLTFKNCQFTKSFEDMILYLSQLFFFLMGFERYNNNGLNDIFGYESVHLSTILQIGFNG